MSKPAWNDAPEWASYLAMDDDYTWWWYEKEPIWDETFGSGEQWCVSNSRIDAACLADDDQLTASDTKEKRP